MGCCKACSNEIHSTGDVCDNVHGALEWKSLRAFVSRWTVTTNTLAKVDKQHHLRGPVGLLRCKERKTIQNQSFVWITLKWYWYWILWGSKALDGVIFLTKFISTFVFYYYLVYLIIRIPRKFHRIKGEERSVKIIKYPFDILYLFEFLVTISNSK